MQIDFLTELADLERLRPEWSALWERCPRATPFQSPEWVLPWYRRLGRGAVLAIARREHGRLTGLAPLAFERFYGTPLRRVTLAGTGVTDYLDVLEEPGPTAAGTWVPEALAGRKGWDFADFQQLRPDSPLMERLPDRGFGSRVTRQEVCPVLPLPGSAAEFRQALPRKLRENLRYYRRRLERERSAHFETAAPDLLPEYLQALMRLHQARWNRRLLPGAFASRAARGFHLEVAPGLMSRGWLRFYGLRVDGRLGAVLYCFLARGRGYYYLGGFDPVYRRSSVGTLLTGYAVEEMIRSGAAEFDFLRGDEPYKYRWGALDRANYRLVLWRPGFPGALAPLAVASEDGAERAVKRAARRLAETTG